MSHVVRIQVWLTIREMLWPRCTCRSSSKNTKRCTCDDRLEKTNKALPIVFRIQNWLTRQGIGMRHSPDAFFVSWERLPCILACLEASRPTRLLLLFNERRFSTLASWYGIIVDDIASGVLGCLSSSISGNAGPKDQIYTDNDGSKALERLLSIPISVALGFRTSPWVDALAAFLSKADCHREKPSRCTAP